MTVASEYRSKAAQLRAEARQSLHPIRKREMEALANAYLRLAEQADRNSRTDVTYEPPVRRRGDRQD